MTNGEKIREMFPNAEISYGLRGVVAVTFIHKTIFDSDWWNAEYKEPSSSEKPNKSEIPTGSIVQERYQDLVDYFGDEEVAKTILEDRKEFKAWLERVKWHIKRVDELARELEQLKSTTKNDLVIDWESYKDVDGNSLDDLILEVLQNNFVCGLTQGYNVAEEIIDLLPSPIKPKGHWKLVQRGKCIDVCCSNCKAVRIKEWAYNYTIDQLDKEDIKECLGSDDMRYCPYCGSDNREVEE